MKNIDQKLLSIIYTVLENNNLPKPKEIVANYNLREDLKMDSLALAELTVRIEAEYGIDIFADGPIYTIEEILTKLS